MIQWFDSQVLGEATCTHLLLPKCGVIFTSGGEATYVGVIGEVMAL